jgi:CRP-like cAMP-binding protein
MGVIEEFSDRLREAARNAEKAHLTAEADELYRLAFEADSLFRTQAAPARDASLGRIARECNNPPAARALSERAREPKLSGILAVEALDLPAARVFLDSARRANPFDAEAASWRGQLNFVERRFPEALADFLEAEWLTPHSESYPGSHHLRALKALMGLDEERFRAETSAAWERLAREASGSGFDFPAGRLEQILRKAAGHSLEGTGAGAIERSRRMRSLEIFAGLDDRALFDLASIAEETRVRKGERAYRASDPSTKLFLVVEGKVELERITPVGGQTLGMALPGDFFGVAEAILRRERLAEATAREDSLLFVLPSAPTERRGAAGLVLLLQAQLARHLRALNDEFKAFFPTSEAPGTITAPARPEDASVPMDEKARLLSQGGLSPSDMALFSSFCTEQTFPAGSVIFREGDAGHALFVVAKGKVRISRRIPGAGEEALAILEPGAIFGEMAIFDPSSEGRSADAFAHEECTLLALDREILETMQRTAPESGADLAAVLCRIAAQRIVETSHKLVQWRLMAGPAL